jgi:hypothetical protein
MEPNPAKTIGTHKQPSSQDKKKVLTHTAVATKQFPQYLEQSYPQ